MTREVLKARRLDPNSRVLRSEGRAKVALTAAEWKKVSEGGCILKEGLEGEEAEVYSKNGKTTSKHHATNTWEARRFRIQECVVQ